MAAINKTINGTVHKIEPSPSVPSGELMQDLATAVATLTSGTPTSAALALTTTPGGASLIGVYDAATLYTATTVEAALAEVKTIADASAPTAALALTTTPGGASLVGVYDAATLYTATNVEAALAEVRVVANAAATKASIWKITLTPSAEGAGAADAIDVVGVVEDLAGLDAAEAKQVTVFAMDEAGTLADVSCTVGTATMQSDTGAGQITTLVTTTAAGAFTVRVTTAGANKVIFTAVIDGGIAANKLLTFAA